MTHPAEPLATTAPIAVFEVDSPEIDEETFTLAEIAARWPRADVAAIDALAPHRSHRFADADGCEVKITRLAPSDLVDDDEIDHDAFGAEATVVAVDPRAPAIVALVEAATSSAIAGGELRGAHFMPGRPKTTVPLLVAAAREAGFDVGTARDLERDGMVAAVLAQLDELDPNDRIAVLVDALISELNDAPPEIGRDLAYRIVTDLRQRGPK